MNFSFPSRDPRADKTVQSQLLKGMTYELIPLKNVHDQAAFLPEKSVMSVTCSPAKTIDDTLDLCEIFSAEGHVTIPHFAARMVESEEHVDRIVHRIQEQGIQTVFIVGGDADQRGPFYDAASFLRSLLERKPDITTVGIGSYPDGHADIPDSSLDEALLEKQELILAAGCEGYIATQMCFDANKIAEWLEKKRKAGITLPCHLGVPGAVDTKKLLSISLRLGIGHSTRFLKKNRSTALRLLSPGKYDPNKLLAPLSNQAETLGISGVHCFTFNSVDTTEEWRKKALKKLSS